MMAGGLINAVRLVGRGYQCGVSSIGSVGHATGVQVFTKPPVNPLALTPRNSDKLGSLVRTVNRHPLDIC